MFLKPYMIPPKFSTKDAYAETLLHLNMLEQYVESLKEKVFYKGTFDFVPTEQRHITKRIVLYIRGQKNIREHSVLAVRLPYKLTPEQREKALKLEQNNIIVEELNLSSKHLKALESGKQYEEEEKKSSLPNSFNSLIIQDKNEFYYQGYGLVYKVMFTQNGLKVIVDINILSPLDAK